VWPEREENPPHQAEAQRHPEPDAQVSAAEGGEGRMGMVALAIIVGFAAWRIEFECLRQRINILDARVKALEERI
jgi:hypothetical protein